MKLLRVITLVVSLLMGAMVAREGQAELTVIKDADGQQGLTVFKMTVSPAAEPVPALKHRLTLRERELKPGNAATHYSRAFPEGGVTAVWKRLEKQHGLDEPYLWLATDGTARWGEMNGAHRTDLDGCTDLFLGCTPFSLTLPIRRLPLHDGDSADIQVATIDVEHLEVVPRRHRYTRLDARRWEFAPIDGGDSDEGSVTFEVDEHGLALDVPSRYRRSA